MPHPHPTNLQIASSGGAPDGNGEGPHGAATPPAAASPRAAGSPSHGTGTGLKPRHVGRLVATCPPTLRLGPQQQAEQAAAARALLAISDTQPEVLHAIGSDSQVQGGGGKGACVVVVRGVC